ncbi:hypothetical protein J8Z28_12185 [Pseudoalteromonas sp. SCSIO 43088]|uniref:hypothetical protein n=1 Tax=Pseudoalteromonas sp. SCSIO 43088 TaxID=2822846 RepID=UPI00202B45BB|nr:hypothetical protein [Pseudoalteromonas sp. SCSIO 43088]URQ85334.1 hypothetical protein J8Z28_12185 [Pseudoalteromonas sp. SCSIO 43088]
MVDISQPSGLLIAFETAIAEIKIIVPFNLQKGLWLNSAGIFPLLRFWLIIRSLQNNNSFLAQCL